MINAPLMRRTRHLLQMSQAELAERARVSQQQISALEGGRRGDQRPDYTAVCRIARALNLSPQRLAPHLFADLPPVIVHLITHWDTLSAAKQARITQTIARHCPDPVDAP